MYVVHVPIEEYTPFFGPNNHGEREGD